MWILSEARKTAYRADCLIFFLLIAMYTWRWIFYTPWKNDDDACCPHIAGEYYINFTISINVLCLTPARRALVTYLKRSMLRSVQLCEYFPSWQRILYVQQITLSQAHGYISTIKACFDSSWARFFFYIKCKLLRTQFSLWWWSFFTSFSLDRHATTQFPANDTRWLRIWCEFTDKQRELTLHNLS